MSWVESQCVNSFLVASLDSGSGYSVLRCPRERTPKAGVLVMMRHPRKRGMSSDRKNVYLQTISVPRGQRFTR